MRSIRVLGVIVCVLLPATGCKKKPDANDEAGPGGGSGVTSKPADQDAPTKPKNTTPAPAPADASSKLGEKAGDDLSRIDVTKAKTEYADKIDLGQLEKPVQRKHDLPLMSFPAPGADVDAKPVKTPGFKVIYNPSPNPTHEQFRKVFQQNRVFEEVAEGLNKTIRLPTSVDINTVDCNTINAFYDPNNKRIIVCYELVTYFLGIFKPIAKNATELGNAVLGALIFSFFHESGHGLIHILDLPAVGREEDAVDQLATLILIAAGDEGVAMAMSGAHWFQLQQKNKDGRRLPFWDEHAFDGQRFYNILCMIYGSNPDKYGSFVTSGTLPKNRAKRCGEEYRKINKGWEKLLQPHLTNGASLNINYKPHVPTNEAPKRTNEDPWDRDDDKRDKPDDRRDRDDDDDDDKPQPPRGGGARITCEQVAKKAAELIGEEAGRRARNMNDEDAKELEARLEHELPAVIEQLIAQCAKENWSERSRRCVIDARTFDQAAKCK